MFFWKNINTQFISDILYRFETNNNIKVFKNSFIGLDIIEQLIEGLVDTVVDTVVDAVT